MGKRRFNFRPYRGESLEARRLLTGTMYLGTNLDGITDWGATSFVDMMDEARPWETRNADGSGAWDSNLSETIPVDSDGWPLEVPFQPITGDPPQVVHSVVPVRGTGIYTLYARGTGKIRFVADQGLLDPTTLFSRSVTFDLTGGVQSFDLEVHPGTSGDGNGELFLFVDASSAADPIRFDFVAPGHEDTYLDQPYDPRYTDALADFSLLRFMDWGKTNNNALVSWDQRTTSNSYTQAGYFGGSLEYIVGLANQQQTDAWINIPASADDEYIRNAAAYIRDHLDPNLKVFVEYSNETWNTIFEQTTYVQDQGEALQLDSDRWKAGQKFAAIRSADAWRIFGEQFGGTAESRIVKVLASHAANINTTQTRMDALLDPAMNPDGIMPDALAVAPYFGTNIAYDIVTSGDLASTTVDDVLDLAENDLRTSVTTWVANHAAIADTYGLWLVTYEGGQHLAGNASMDALTDLLIAANRSPRMYDLYYEYMSMLRDGGVVLHSNFSYTAEPSRFGSWGAQEYPGQPLSEAHKLRAMQDWIQLNPPSNLPPSTRAGSDIFTYAGSDEEQIVQLDGSASRDLDGTIVDFRWELDGAVLGVSPTLDVTLPIGEHQIQLVATDDQGATSTDTVYVSVLPKTASRKLLTADFSGASPGLNLPWTAHTEEFPHFDYLGWQLGSGFTGSGFDDGLSFYGVFEATETTLADAFANDNYLSTQLASHTDYTLDLRGAQFDFSIDRIDGHSPRRYVVTSSQDDFSSILFDTNRISTRGQSDFSFRLPFDFETQQEIEFRIYAFEARYARHDASLVAFELGGAVVGPVNVVLDSPQYVNEGESFDVSLSAVSPEPAPPPSTWIVDWGDGSALEVFSGDVRSHVYPDDGVYQIVAYAFTPEFVWQGFDMATIIVNNVTPVVDLQAPEFGDEGASYEIFLGDVFDPGSDLVTEYHIDWGDGSIADVRTEPGTIYHTYVDDGQFELSVDLIDEDGKHVGTNAQLVTIRNITPTIEALGSGQSTEGTAYSLELGRVLDPGSEEVTGVQIDWGDGSPPIVATTSSAYEHTYADDGSPTITVLVTDEDGQHVAATKSVSVANVTPSVTFAGNQQTDEGASFALSVEQIFDPGTDSVSEVLIDWGDGSPYQPFADLQALEHYFSDDGQYNITATLIDEDGVHPNAGNFEVTVNNILPEIVALSGDITGNQGDELSFWATVIDPGLDDTITYIWDFGDSTSVAGTSLQAVSHVYELPGDYEVTLTVADDDGSSESASIRVTVSDGSPSALLSGEEAIAEGDLYTLDVSIEPSALLSEIWIDWGDGSDAERYTTSGTYDHRYLDDGDFTITLDAVMGSVSYPSIATKSLAVANVPPTLGLNGPDTVEKCVLYTVNFSDVIDPGLDLATELLVDWGDNSPIEAFAPNSAAQHIYVESGSYSIVVSVIDDDGVHQAVATKPLLVQDLAELVTLVETPLDAVGAALESPHTEASTIHPQVQWHGWTLGSGFTASGEGTGLRFFGDYPAAESDLSHAIANNLYAAASLEPASGYQLDLSNGSFRFDVHRIQAHAPRNYAVMSSVDGFSTQTVLFDTGRLVSRDPQSFEFSLPGSSAYSLGTPLEFRVYAYGGRYFGHDSSLVGFELSGRATLSSGPIPPVFTSPDEASVAEGTRFVQLLEFNDPDNSPGSATLALDTDSLDGAWFELVENELHFVAPPDYEQPLDVDGDNIYHASVSATDSEGNTGSQILAVTVTPVNESAPTLSVANLTTLENSVEVGQLVPTDEDLPLVPLTVSLTGNGSDDLQFSIEENRLSFLSPPDYESPSDNGGVPGDNTYEVEVRIDDGNGLFSVQSLSITVLDDLELATPTTLLESNLVGAGHGLSLPHSSTNVLASEISVFSGWQLGSGLAGSEFDGLSFYGSYPAAESDLDEAIANDRYLAFTLELSPTERIDLRGATTEFHIQRQSFHAPRTYAVMSSVDGFSNESSILFTTPRLTSTDMEEFEFSFPDSSDFAAIDNLEFRIYALGGRYTGHDASLTHFRMTGRL